MSGSDFVVKCHAGTYSVQFSERSYDWLSSLEGDDFFFLIDEKACELHALGLAPILVNPERVHVVQASETAKSLEHLAGVVEAISQSGFRRGGTLVAIGGGITQDIVCFLAAVLYRGVDWLFVPTTLLAQADSCIGSKSSINVLGTKNLLGTFTPPKSVIVDEVFLGTLDRADVFSGVGEMLKVHAIAGPEHFSAISQDLLNIYIDQRITSRYILASLKIKQTYIEQDEYDRDVRNILNYGHSFGHAIESATSYAIPHGVAVTIGMDMANHVATDLGISIASIRDAMAPTLRTNYSLFAAYPIDLEHTLSALARDKKNTRVGMRLVLPDQTGNIGLHDVALDLDFRQACASFLWSMTS